MSNVCLSTKGGAWAQHICATTRELGIGRQHIERVFRQKVVKLEVSYASVALVCHRVEINVANNMSPASAFLQQSISREFRCLAQLGVGMNGHLWESYICQAKVAIDTAQVHRGDIPLQVCSKLRTLCKVLHRTCRANVNNRRHHYITCL